MSQDQADAVVGRLVRERGETQQHLTLLQAEARNLAKVFTGLGVTLQPDAVWNMSLESCETFVSKETFEQIKKLKVEIPRVEQNLVKLNDELKKLGVN